MPYRFWGLLDSCLAANDAIAIPELPVRIVSKLSFEAKNDSSIAC